MNPNELIIRKMPAMRIRDSIRVVSINPGSFYDSTNTSTLNMPYYKPIYDYLRQIFQYARKHHVIL